MTSREAVSFCPLSIGVLKRVLRMICPAFCLLTYKVFVIAVSSQPERRVMYQTREVYMKRTQNFLKGLMLGFYSLAVVCSLFWWGGVSSAIAAPPSNPNPTTDLSGVTQNWDKVLPASQRFVVLSAFSNAAVLDKETGLVWEKSPDAVRLPWSTGAAQDACAQKVVGSRKGWRLPALDELASLVDPNASSAPVLPAGHPFTNVQPEHYWAATQFADHVTSTTRAWGMYFGNGSTFTDERTYNGYYWCVRGNGHLSQY